jgi:O-acetyl-ADP-ribose deacetylase
MRLARAGKCARRRPLLLVGRQDMSSPGLFVEPVVTNLHGKIIRLEKGDLTALPVDAFVFYAREDLQLGSGFGTAIQTRGGTAIKEQLKKIGRIGMGQAVVTTAGTMRPRHIIHACGPKFQEPDREPKLRRAVKAALDAAASAGFASVAFPPMGAGFYSIPLDLCVNAMLQEISRSLAEGGSLAEVIICVVDNREFRAFQPKLETLAGEKS